MASDPPKQESDPCGFDDFRYLEDGKPVEELTPFQACLMAFGWGPNSLTPSGKEDLGTGWEHLQRAEDANLGFGDLVKKIKKLADDGKLGARSWTLIPAMEAGLNLCCSFSVQADIIEQAIIQGTVIRECRVSRAAFFEWAKAEGVIGIDYDSLLSKQDGLPIEAAMWLLFDEYLPPTDDALESTRELDEVEYRNGAHKEFWNVVSDAIEDGSLTVRGNRSDRIKRVDSCEFSSSRRVRTRLYLNRFGIGWGKSEPRR